MTVNNHLGRQLREIAVRYPDRLALTVAGHGYRYGELHALAALLARGFAGTEGQYCALLGGRGLPVLAGIVAALCYGKTYLPLPEDDSIDRLTALARACELDLLVADAADPRSLRVLLGGAVSRVTVILAGCTALPDWCAHYPAHRFLSLGCLRRLPEAKPTTENPDAYLLFTSGSTGTPKGVQVSHANVTHYVANTVALYQPVPDDRFSQLAPLGFDFSVHDLFVPWAVGASTHVFDAANAFALGRFIQSSQLTFWASVPSTVLFMRRMRQLPPNAFPTVRQTLFCGEPLLEEMAECWSRAAPGSRIDNIYGPTEATVAVCGFQWHPGRGAADGGIVPIGRPYPGTELKIGDARHGNVMAEGELWIGGRQVVAGYWPGLPVQAERFVNARDGDWYRTGDWVRLDGEGCLHFLGRCDDQLQVRGQRIERLEVETLLRRLLRVDDVAVVGWPVIEGHSVESLAFFIDSAALDHLEARKRCRQGLPRPMWPSRLIFGEIPKNRHGKTDYRQLEARLREHAQTHPP